MKALEQRPLPHHMPGHGRHTGSMDPATSGTNAIELASALLQISEYRFFQTAYTRWYGTAAPDAVMEDIFTDYMFFDTVPPWARHLARRVIEEHEEGLLNPAEYGVSPPSTTYEMRTRGEWYLMVIFFLMSIFCFMISGYVPPQ